ncbi:MAG: hypothetical protein RIS70_695 [Planctomycetota bacterium]|jgi:uncharacterized protein (DUF58 family)
MTQRIRLTREGIYYLFVLLFVMGGAVFREVNLLLVISAIMIGPIVFSWRLVAASLNRLQIERKLPKTMAVNQPFTVTLTVANGRWRLPTWGLHLHDTVQSRNPSLPTTTSVAKTFVPCVSAQSSESVEYSVRPTRRGRLRFKSLTASTQFPWGFVTGRRIESQHEEVIVTPRIGTLTSRWMQLIGAAQASHQATERQRWSGKRRGVADGDYYGLRQWRAGDSSRWIHWRTSAKIGGLAVLQFEQRPQQDLDLLLDLWLPEKPDSSHLVALERAIEFATTAIADLGRRGIGKLHVTIAGVDQQVFERAATQWFAGEILEYLAEVQGGRGIHAALLEARTAAARRSSRIVVISTRSQNAIAPDRGLSGCEWIDVSAPQVSGYFQGADPS